MMSLRMLITGQESPAALLLVLGCTEISALRRQLVCQLAILEYFEGFGGH